MGTWEETMLEISKVVEERGAKADAMVAKVDVTNQYTAAWKLRDAYYDTIRLKEELEAEREEASTWESIAWTLFKESDMRRKDFNEIVTDAFGDGERE